MPIKIFICNTIEIPIWVCYNVIKVDKGGWFI